MSDTSIADAQLHEQNMHVAIKKEEPFYLLRPGMHIDGDQWCALYGDNIQDGVAGFGKSPELAKDAFNEAWYEELP